MQKPPLVCVCMWRFDGRFAKMGCESTRSNLSFFPRQHLFYEQHLLFLSFKRDKPTKHNKKRLLRKLLNYLKSDHYMLAPLIDHLSSSYSSAFMNCSSSGSGPVTRTPTKQNGKKLEDYLKYDSHMYAPLVVSTTATATATGFRQVFSAAKSKRKMVEGANQESEHSTDVRTENSTEEYTLQQA